MTVLAIRNLAKAYGGVQAVRDVSFVVAAGELLAMIGPNGAGKTTCFNMLNGQVTPDAGSVEFEGRSLLGLTPRQIWRLGVGRTFQITATFGSMTVRENVQMALLSHHRRLWSMTALATRSFVGDADALLARVGMREQADRPCAVLAYGDLKRVELAVALASVFIERMRNGIIVLALLLLATGLLSLFALRPRLRKTALVTATVALFLIAIGGLGVATAIKPIASNFKDLVASVSIAWDTERYTAWRDDKQAPPVLPSGETIDTSVYQRIAWFKQGLLIAREHPLGVGFGRNAFGHGLKAKYGEGGGHSHSGLLDLAIGTGVPGIILWLGFLASLGYLAWKQYRHTRSFAALLLLLLLLDFGARMFLDSIIRDHMLQQFMFLVGLAAVMMVAEGPEKRKPSA